MSETPGGGSGGSIRLPPLTKDQEEYLDRYRNWPEYDRTIIVGGPHSGKRLDEVSPTPNREE